MKRYYLTGLIKEDPKRKVLRGHYDTNKGAKNQATFINAIGGVISNPKVHDKTIEPVRKWK